MNSVHNAVVMFVISHPC